MTEPIDTLGPVDYLVIEFPGSRINGEIGTALLDLVNREVIRVLDLVVIKKDAVGSFEAFEFGDIDDRELGAIRSLEFELAQLVCENDVASVSEALEPGNSAGLLEPLGRPIRVRRPTRRGQLVANGPIGSGPHGRHRRRTGRSRRTTDEPKLGA